MKDAFSMHLWLLLPAPLVLLTVGASACVDGGDDVSDFPVISSTDRITIRSATYLSSSVCAGDRLSFDSLIGSVAGDLGIDLVDDVSLYLVDVEDAQRYCDTAYGCYQPAFRRVVTSPYAALHEVVHAVVHQAFESPPVFFDEGLADAYTLPTRRGELNIGEIIEKDAYPVDTTQQHFARWVLAREDGLSVTRQLLSGEPAEQVFGMSLTDIEEHYAATSPDIYELDGFCGAPEMERMAGDAWNETVRISCNAADVEGILAPGISGPPTVRRVFTIEDPGRYVFSVSGSAALTLAVAGCPRADDPVPDAASYDHSVYVGMFSGVAGEIIPAGTPRTLELAAIRHRVLISTASDGEEITVDVRRAAD